LLLSRCSPSGMFHSGWCNSTFLMMHAARCGVVVDCHANYKGAHRAIRSVNPATGDFFKTFTEHTDQDMMGALATADKALASWAARPIEERAKIISRTAQLLLERKSELAKLATLEMGKRIAESRGEVELSAAILQYFADHAAEFLAPKLKHAPGVP
jgi:acyl-CoA reductase-like NAD-dependent aldehyde dehydrogenase